MAEQTTHPEAANEAAPEAQKSLEEQLADAQANIEQQREAMMRAVAEADNTRKRAQVEATNARKYALERFVESLLPALDSLGAALTAQNATTESMRNGVELTLRQLMSAFEKASLSEINPKPGERFDPHRHQAMAAVPSDGEPNTIVSVMQKGYGLHDRVVRPALVTVSKALEKGTGNPISDTDLDQSQT
jgi:molecular chaperone GrpE